MQTEVQGPSLTSCCLLLNCFPMWTDEPCQQSSLRTPVRMPGSGIAIWSGPCLISTGCLSFHLGGLWQCTTWPAIAVWAFSSDGKGSWQPGTEEYWARVGKYSVNREPRRTTGPSKCSRLQPCSRQRFPSVTALPRQGRGFPPKLLQFCLVLEECSVTTLLS